MKVETKIVEQLADLQEGATYQIESAEVITTSQRGYKGIRVKVTNVETDEECATMLWLNDAVGARTKLGCFVDTLGYDTDQWIGKEFMVMIWRQGNRQIEAYGETDKKQKTKKVKKKDE